MNPDYCPVQHAARGTHSPRRNSHVHESVDSRREGKISREKDFSASREARYSSLPALLPFPALGTRSSNAILLILRNIREIQDRVSPGFASQRVKNQ